MLEIQEFKVRSTDVDYGSTYVCQLCINEKKKIFYLFLSIYCGI